MTTTLDELLALQTPENQAKIEARAAEMLIEIEGKKDDTKDYNDIVDSAIRAKELG